MREAKKENNKISRMHATNFFISCNIQSDCFILLMHCWQARRKNRLKKRRHTGETETPAAENAIPDPRVFHDFFLRLLFAD